jgi:hypothetical protein
VVTLDLVPFGMVVWGEELSVRTRCGLCFDFSGSSFVVEEEFTLRKKSQLHGGCRAANTAINLIRVVAALAAST